jgi:Protein of unknown function (DUF2783)
MSLSTRLRTEDHLANPDDVYNLLIEAHRDLSPEQSRLLDAKLILLLANHIGDPALLAEAIALAKAGLTTDGS